MKPALKNFWEPTPKKLKRLAWAIKAFAGSTGLVSLAAGYTWLAVTLAVFGGLSDFIIEMFKEDNNGTENENI
jgi:hypothetical protein